MYNHRYRYFYYYSNLLWQVELSTWTHSHTFTLGVRLFFASTLLCRHFQMERHADLRSWWKWLIALEAERYFSLPFVRQVDVWKGRIIGSSAPTVLWAGENPPGAKGRSLDTSKWHQKAGEPDQIKKKKIITKNIIMLSDAAKLWLLILGHAYVAAFLFTSSAVI